MAQLSERIARLEASVVREILAAAQSRDVISFAGGLPAGECIPKLSAVTLDEGLGQYGLTEGEPRLRQALSRYLEGISLACPAERVMILSGSQQGIDLVAKLFVDVGSKVVTESPTYLAALQVFRLFGADVCGLPLGPAGIRPGALHEQAPGARLAYLIPTFQNPTGRAYDDATRTEIARVLDRHGLPLFEDDPYREVSFDGAPPSPVAGRLRNAPWVYQGSFSKMFVPGLRLGFLAASADLFPHLSRLKQAADLHSNRLSQSLALSDLTSPGRGVRLEALRTAYREKRRAFQAALDRHLGGLATWELPPGGLFFWVRLNEPRPVAALLPRAIERGVVFVPGEACFPEREPPEGYLRLNFSHATPDQMETGLARLASVLSG